MFIKNKLYKEINKLIMILEKSNITEISYIIGNKKEIFIRNIFAGIARGVGIGIGVTLITAIIVITAQRIIKLNIPIIGEYVSDILNIVEQKKY